MQRSASNKRQRRKASQELKVKLGHGGTLDPLATGVLIVGVGKGTKQLQRFLECTKSYETTVVFGAATDTYDNTGKIVRKADYGHVTKIKVEEALKQFRGEIMQKPPIFSALKVKGKKLYEYAREGIEVPVEIKSRPVEVKEMKLVDWVEGDSGLAWPAEEAPQEEKEVVEKILHVLDAGDGNTTLETGAKREERGWICGRRESEWFLSTSEEDQGLC